MSRICPFVLVCLIAVAAGNANGASPSGTWRGSWSSPSTGHSGALRARIRQTGPDSYRAIFAGRFAGVVPFIYPAKLERVPGNCDCYVSSQRLPLLGTYRMTASVSQRRFYATFQGKNDRGTFHMTR